MIDSLVDLPLILDNSKATAEADQFVERAAEGPPRSKQDEVSRKEKAAELDVSTGVVKELDGSAGVLKELVRNSMRKQHLFSKIALNPSGDLKV